MGSDQSRVQNDSVSKQDSTDLESTASVEVPYVSYTVNRPIGGEEDPAKGGAKKKSTSAAKSGQRLRSQLFKSSKNTMVTVNEGRSRADRLSSSSSDAADPDLIRLREIPSFLPIIRASLSGSGGLAKADPDILERLDYRGLSSLCQRYEDHARLCAATVATEQAELTRMMKEADAKSAQVNKVLAEKHKNYTQKAEKLSKVNDMSKCLAKCHLLLNENIEQMEVLNNMLPQDQRLEPFVWTTNS